MLQASINGTAVMGKNSQVALKSNTHLTQLPLLGRDIRKIPTKEAPQRHHSIVTFSNSGDSLPPSSDSGGNLSSSVGDRPESSSATSYMPSENSTTASVSSQKKTKRTVRKKGSPDVEKVIMEEDVRKRTDGYWNEYDFPEEGEDNDAYVIYVDPNAEITYPGHEMVEKLVSWIRHSFITSSKDEQQPIISPIDPQALRGEDDMPSSSDEMDSLTGPKAQRHPMYGTILPGPAMATIDSNASPSFLSNLNPFDHSKPRRKSRARQTSQHHIDPFAAELERQFHERESSKLRTCLTSLAASVAILVVSFVLAATGRRKQVGTVDEGVLFGIVASLLFAGVGVGYLLSLSWIAWDEEMVPPPSAEESKVPQKKLAKIMLRSAVGLVFVGVCVANGALVAWMIA